MLGCFEKHRKLNNQLATPTYLLALKIRYLNFKFWDKSDNSWHVPTRFQNVLNFYTKNFTSAELYTLSPPHNWQF